MTTLTDPHPTQPTGDSGWLALQRLPGLRRGMAWLREQEAAHWMHQGVRPEADRHMTEAARLQQLAEIDCAPNDRSR